MTTLDAVTPVDTMTTVDTVTIVLPVDTVDVMPVVAPVTCHVCTPSSDSDLEL